MFDVYEQQVLNLIFEKFYQSGDLCFLTELEACLSDKHLFKAKNQLLMSQRGILSINNGKVDFHFMAYFSTPFWKEDLQTIDRLWPVLRKLYGGSSYMVSRLFDEGFSNEETLLLKRGLFLLTKINVIGVGPVSVEGDFGKTVFVITQEVKLHDSISEKLDEDMRESRYWAVFPNFQVSRKMRDENKVKRFLYKYWKFILGFLSLFVGGVTFVFKNNQLDFSSNQVQLTSNSGQINQISKQENNYFLTPHQLNIRQSSVGSNSPNIIGNGNQVNIQASLKPRRILGKDRQEITDLLAKTPGKVRVYAAMNDPEAYRFAQDWFEVLKIAGWDTQGSIVTYMLGGQPDAGVVMRISGGYLGSDGIFHIPTENPIGNLGICLQKFIGHDFGTEPSEKLPKDIAILRFGVRPEK